jgi:hypothetical protein
MEEAGAGADVTGGAPSYMLFVPSTPPRAGPTKAEGSGASENMSTGGSGNGAWWRDALSAEVAAAATRAARAAAALSMARWA